MDDIPAEIVEKCRRGDVQAFAAVVAHYERPLTAYLFRLGARGDAEDLVQEVFVKAWMQIQTFDPARGSRFAAWLFRIARNHCISEWRRGRPDRGALIGMGPERVHALADERHASPREAAWRRECAARVEQAVAGLEEPYRSAFILRHYEEMDYADIATILQTNEATVRSRVARSRQKLALALKDLRNPDGGEQHDPRQQRRHDVPAGA